MRRLILSWYLTFSTCLLCYLVWSNVPKSLSIINIWKEEQREIGKRIRARKYHLYHMLVQSLIILAWGELCKQEKVKKCDLIANADSNSVPPPNCAVECVTFCPFEVLKLSVIQGTSKDGNTTWVILCFMIQSTSKHGLSYVFLIAPLSLSFTGFAVL